MGLKPVSFIQKGYRDVPDLFFWFLLISRFRWWMRLLTVNYYSDSVFEGQLREFGRVSGGRSRFWSCQTTALKTRNYYLMQALGALMSRTLVSAPTKATKKMMIAT